MSANPLADTIYYVKRGHPNADDANPGTEEQPLKTISRAAELAHPGDTVLVYSGVYREHVAPARGGIEGRPITYEAAAGEHVVVKGSEIWKPEWVKDSDSEFVCSGNLNPKLFGDFHPFRTAARDLEGKRTLGQVFVDGRLYAEVDNREALLAAPGTWMIDPEFDRLHLHLADSRLPLEERGVEITVRNRIFAPHRRGLGYITVRGFTFEHCANQFPASFWAEGGAPQAGALGCRSGHHWVIEGNTIRFANSIGIDCGSEGYYDPDQPELEYVRADLTDDDARIPKGAGYHRIHGNTISDNGACGIVGWNHTGTRITGNLLERNNALGWTSPESGGIKMHGFLDGLIEGNVLRDNDCFGIWLDNVYYGSRITRNVILGSTGGGVFIELGEGDCLVDTNVIAFTRNGEGIYTHDASGVTVAHNLLLGNSHFGVYMRVVTDRPVRLESGELIPAATRNQRIFNNVFIDNYRGHICLPLSGPQSEGNLSDYNLFINGSTWHWEGLGLNRFVMTGSNGDDGWNRLESAFAAALEEHGVPENNRPNLKLWREQPYLSFEWWQMLTGQDRNSFVPTLDKAQIENGAVAKGSISLAVGEMYVQFASDKPFRKLQCPPVPGVDKDFYGKALDSRSVLPGPFQTYRDGYNRMVLANRTEA